MKRSKIVLAKLPRTGLGNKLFVWAHAKIFGYLNNIGVYSLNWVTLHPGPYLRREKNKRFYYGYFKRLSLNSRIKLAYCNLFYRKIVEPKIEKTEPAVIRNAVIIFNKIPHWSDHYKEIRDYRSYIIDEIYSTLISNRVKIELSGYEPPDIGVHIRMGDFIPVGDEKWKPYGGSRTPLTYFINQINNIRKYAGVKVNVTVFSDGHFEELKPILNLPNVRLSKSASDIVDLLLLAKSKVIVISTGSTFGYWSVFLSEAICIRSIVVNPVVIRPSDINEKIFEGEVSDDHNLWPDRLKSELESCQFTVA